MLAVTLYPTVKEAIDRMCLIDNLCDEDLRTIGRMSIICWRRQEYRAQITLINERRLNLKIQATANATLYVCHASRSSTSAPSALSPYPVEWSKATPGKDQKPSVPSPCSPCQKIFHTCLQIFFPSVSDSPAFIFSKILSASSF